MSDWIGLAVIGFLVLSGVVGLWWISRPYEVSVEEFEKLSTNVLAEYSPRTS